MTGRGSGAPPDDKPGSATMSFSERYAPPKPPRWRRVFSLETAQSVLTLLIAVGLIVLIGYLTWISIERSGRLADPPDRSSDRSAAAPAGTRVIELTSADGTALSAWSTPSKAKKSDTAVILVHDAGGQRADLKRLAAALRDEHDVLTLDLRGHGASAGGATTLGPAEAEDVRAAIEAVVGEGDRRVALVGVGLGAAAVLAAASGDSRIDGIVAVAPWPRVADAVSAQLRDDGVTLAWPADWATLVAMLFRTGRDVTSADVMDTVARTTAPILVVAGTQDPLLPAATLRTLENLAPDLTTWQVKGDRDDTTAVVGEDEGIKRIAAFIDASFKRGD
jgi:pimeloyl-ACP methyl ester carboxylesterase